MRYRTDGRVHVCPSCRSVIWAHEPTVTTSAGIAHEKCARPGPEAAVEPGHSGLCPMSADNCRGSQDHRHRADKLGTCVNAGCYQKCECALIHLVRAVDHATRARCEACGLPWCGCQEIADAYDEGRCDAALAVMELEYRVQRADGAERWTFTSSPITAARGGNR